MYHGKSFHKTIFKYTFTKCIWRSQRQIKTYPCYCRFPNGRDLAISRTFTRIEIICYKLWLSLGQALNMTYTRVLVSPWRPMKEVCCYRRWIHSLFTSMVTQNDDPMLKMHIGVTSQSYKNNVIIISDAFPIFLCSRKHWDAKISIY